MGVFFPFAGQSREPFKIREQIKLEALDSDEEEKQQPLAMASNSIFESFSSYQSCFSRGEYPRQFFYDFVQPSSYLHPERINAMFEQSDDTEVLVCSVSGVLKSCGWIWKPQVCGLVSTSLVNLIQPANAWWTPTCLFGCFLIDKNYRKEAAFLLFRLLYWVNLWVL